MKTRFRLMAAGVTSSLAIATAIALIPSTTSTAAARWRLVKTDPSLAFGPRIVASGRNSAWAFGGRGSTEAVQWPTAYRWDGSTWQQVALPAGRHGAVTAASASSADNVWTAATSGNDQAIASVAMRWNGREWALVKRLPDTTVTDVTTTGPRDAWIFGTVGQTNRGVSWHYTGQDWAKVDMPFAVFRASARSATDIWAVGWRQAGGDESQPMVGHYDGKRWTTVSVDHALPPDPKDPTHTLITFNAVTATKDGVWITADVNFQNDHRTDALLLSLTGQTWRHESVTKIAGRWAEGAAPVPDGRGGMWFLGSADDNGFDSTLVHRSASGKWIRSPIRATGAPSVQVSTLAGLPGTTQLLAAGLLYQGSNKAGAILSYQ